MALKHDGIIRLGYVRLALADAGLEKARGFYRSVLGLVESGATPDRALFRCWHEPYRYSMVLEAAPAPGLVEIGFQVRAPRDLAALRSRVEAAGVKVDAAPAGEALPGLSESISFRVPHGPRLRLFSGLEQPGYLAGDRSPDWVTPRSVRGTPAPMFINHAAVTSDDPGATVEFCARTLGFGVSEKMVADSDGRTVSALLFRMSKNVGGQELAVFPGEAGRLHHVAFTKDDASDILVDGQYLRQDGVAIDLAGPTRQPYGNTFSLHFRDPFGVRLELCSGGRMSEVHPEFEPVVWTESNAARAFAYYDDQLETGFLAASL